MLATSVYSGVLLDAKAFKAGGAIAVHIRFLRPTDGRGAVSSAATTSAASNDTLLRVAISRSLVCSWLQWLVDARKRKEALRRPTAEDAELLTFGFMRRMSAEGARQPLACCREGREAQPSTAAAPLT